MWSAGVLLFAITLVGTNKWVPFMDTKDHKVMIKCVESTDEKTVIKFEIPGMNVAKRTNKGGEEFDYLSIPDVGWIPNGIGKPELPCISVLVAIPSTKDVDIVVEDAQTKELSGYKVYPVQPPLPDMKGVPEPEFAIDRAFYSKDIIYPEKIAYVSEPMVWRDYRIVEVLVYPVRYNPATQTLHVTYKLTVKLLYSGYNSKNIPKLPPRPTRNFDKLYRKFIINYNFVRKSKGEFPQEGRYFIITADEFADAIKPLAKWKHKKGIQVTIRTVTEIGGGDSAHIHAAIQNAYDNWATRPEFVLLVGDTCYLQPGRREIDYGALIGTYYPVSDHCFSRLDGTDWFADVFIGRLPVKTIVQCNTVVQKLLNYERSPDLTNPDYYRKATTASIVDRLFFDTADAIARMLKRYGFIQADTLVDPPASRISDSLEAGRSFVVYRAHGDYFEWQNPGFDTTYAKNLNNPRPYPVVIAPTCRANNFGYDPQRCLGEAFFVQDKGAIGYFGATEISYSYWNDALGRGIFHAILEDTIYQFQVACNYGKVYMEQHYKSITDNGTQDEFHLFNILGDPELPIWTVPPESLRVTHPDSLPMDAKFTVCVKDTKNIPLADAKVCCMMDSTVYVVEMTNEMGEATFDISFDHPGTLWVTVTRHVYKRQHIPYEGFAIVVDTAGVPSTPVVYAPFDLAKIKYNSPTFEFSSQDPEGDDIRYEIQWDTTFTFSSPNSELTGLYTSGTRVSYTLTSVLESGKTYWWRVRAIDPNGSNYYSGWSEKRSFTIDTDLPEDCAWFMGTPEQFESCSLKDAIIEDTAVLIGYLTRTVLLSESFEGSFPPPGWKVEKPGVSANQWQQTSARANSGSYSAYVAYDGSNDVETWLVTPAIHFETVEGESLIIWMNNDYADYQRYNGLWIGGTNAIDQMVEVTQFHITAEDAWEQRVVDLTKYGEDSVFLAFKYKGENGDNWYLDDVEVFGYIRGSSDSGVLVTPEIVFSDFPDVAGDWDKIVWTKSSSADSIGIRVDTSHTGGWGIAIPDTFIMGVVSCTLNVHNRLVSGNPPVPCEKIKIIIKLYNGTSKAASDPALKNLLVTYTLESPTHIYEPTVSFKYFLAQNYPNPFSRSTIIRYGVARTGHVELKIYDISGRLIKTLINATQKPGVYITKWDGSDDRLKKVASGVYFCKFTADEFKNTRKIILIR